MSYYTLPPVPHMIANTQKELERIRDYGHACAEAALAPLLARIAELEASVGVWQKTAGYCAEEIKERAEQCDRLRAEVKALREDAERYRAWRHAFREGDCGVYNAICNAESESEHDAAIDSAIAAQRGEGD